MSSIFRFLGILAVMNGAILIIGRVTDVIPLIFHLFTIPLSILCIYCADNLASGLGALLSDWIPKKSDRYSQFSADLAKSKLSKQRKHFAEALQLVNNILREEPDFPEARFLKAQILWEGFGNAEAAKGYLIRIRQLVPKGESLHTWASTYLEEMTMIKGTP